jgi:hypothetical protein
VVRNGHLPERELQTGLGPVTVRIPKVRSKDGEPSVTAPGDQKGASRVTACCT